MSSAPPNLPCNLDAERSVLGAILIENSIFSPLRQLRIIADDFFLDSHQVVFRAIERLYDKKKPIDILTLTEELSASGHIERAGGHAIVAALIDGVPKISNVAYYAQIVKEKAHLRRLAHLGYKLQQQIVEDGNPEEVIQEIAKERRSAKNGDAPTSLKIPDMPEDVLDGALGDVCGTRMARFPRAYAWSALVAVAGTMIPKNASPLRANLYVALVGAIHSGKTQAEEHSRNLIGIVPPQLQAVMSGSAEGLLGKIKDAEGEGRIVCPDELGHLFTKASIENASFPFILNRAFYQSEFDLTSAHGKIVHFNSCLSLLGGIVSDDFQNYFDSGTVGGLHDRFIFGVCPEPFEFEYYPFEGSAETFLSKPKAAYISPEVWEVKKQWLKDHPGMSPRTAEIALRVAAICAAYDGRATLRGSELRPALALAKHQQRVRIVFRPNPGENPDARCGFAVLSNLERHGNWVNCREFYRQIHADRYGPGIYNRVLHSLAMQGEIELSPKNKEMRILL